MNPHLLRKFRQRGNILGMIDIVRGTRTIAACTRATVASYFDSSGNRQTAAINEKVFDYDPATGRFLGLRREKGRTNSIRNNTMAGASAGSPGTLPTNWSTFTTLTGLTRTVVGTGTENGLYYIDIRLNGTPSAAGHYFLQAETSTSVAASNGQTWAGSAFYKLVGGTLTGVTFANFVSSRDSGGADLGGGSVAFTPSASALSAQRVQTTFTNVSASTAAELHYIDMVLSGAAVDFTLRIGSPQLELCGSSTAKASSVIDTSGSALARSPDVISITGSDYTSLGLGSAGAIFARFTLANVANGASQKIVRLSDNTNNNGIDMISSASGFATLVTASGGIFDGSANSAVLTNSVESAVACAYASNDLALVKDSSSLGTDSTATIPTGLTRLDIGSDHAGANDCEVLWLQYLGVMPSRQANNVLQRWAA